tara:strand:+ start:100 stop:1056 length:957 start_codon:yes stop_codon:yes gene_type:complete
MKNILFILALLISFTLTSQNISLEVTEIINNDNQSKGEEFVSGVIYNGAYVVENNYYYEYNIVDCEYQKKASKNPKFLENVSYSQLSILNENSALGEIYNTIGRNNYNIVFKYSCKDGSNEFKLSYEFTNGLFSPIFKIDDLIKSNSKNVKFLLDENFIKITSDYWDREMYKEDFKDLSYQTDVLDLKLQEIESITKDLFTNEDILFYVKNDLSAILTIETSGLSFEEAVKYEDEMCSNTQKMLQDFGKILYFNCGIEEINGFNYFISEIKSEIELDLNYNQYNWSNQYWREVNGSTYHITINSESGLKIQDVLIDIR